ncbi:hypothetical protein JCM15519_14040 [Fundidesulfovibrio butyratiphilus]
MRTVYGVDFTSAPGRNAFLAVCRCTLREGALTLEEFHAWRNFAPLVDLLASPGPWAMGLDFPFGQPASLARECPDHFRAHNLPAWPLTWSEFVEAATALERKAFVAFLESCPTTTSKRSGKPIRERRRIADALSGAESPQHVNRPPVGLMFHAGAGLLLRSPAHIHPVRPNGDPRLVFETYPGVFARDFAGLDGYKGSQSDKAKAAHQADRRKKLLDSLASPKLAHVYGVSVRYTPEQAERMIQDRGGDLLDAFVCAVQAAWAQSALKAGFDPCAQGPHTLDQEAVRFEGWIMDPSLTPWKPAGEGQAGPAAPLPPGTEPTNPAAPPPICERAGRNPATRATTPESPGPADKDAPFAAPSTPARRTETGEPDEGETAAKQSAQPHPLVPHPWLAFLVCSLATFMGTLDASIVNVALPTIAGQFGVDVSLVQWTVSSYLLTVCMLLPLSGRIGDAIGVGLLFRIGMGVFTLGSLLCGLSTGLWLLVGARVAQGLGATVMMAAAPAIVIIAFPGPQRGRALGLTATVVAIGSLVGPAVGGIILGGFGWPAIFFINIPFGIMGLIFSGKYLPRGLTRRNEPMDLAGATFFAVSVCALVLGMGGGNDWGWLSPESGACLALTLGFGALFLAREVRAAHPLVSPSLFRNRLFTTSLAACVLAYMAAMFNTILLPFYLHDQLRLAPHEMGLILSLAPMVTALSAPLSGYASERVNPALLALIGFSLTAMGMFHQSGLNAASPLWSVSLGQMILGLGFGVFNSPNNNIVMSCAPASMAGQVGAVQALARNIGLVCGAAVGTAVFELVRNLSVHAPDPFSHGFRAALGLAFALACAGALLCALGLGPAAHMAFGRAAPEESSPPQA